MDSDEFRTERGYSLARRERDNLTASMEDYLEMMYRLSEGEEKVKATELAQALDVNPSSVTDMIRRLSRKEMVDYRPYRGISLTDEGKSVGASLLARHRMFERFMKHLGLREAILENVERLEHNLTSEAVQLFGLLVEFIEREPGWWEEFVRFRAGKRQLEKQPDVVKEKSDDDRDKGG